jgi:hypothetical protein
VADLTRQIDQQQGSAKTQEVRALETEIRIMSTRAVCWKWPSGD